ncbi:MAG: hypothetical protein R3B99_16735 [Polyangiales bacterium]
MRFEVHGDLGWRGFLGAGFDVEIPIVPNGFLPARDSRRVRARPGLRHSRVRLPRRHPRRRLRAAAHRAVELYVHPKWSIFPRVGAAVFFVSDQYWYHDAPYRHGVARSRIPSSPSAPAVTSPTVSRVTMRIGYPFGAQAGVTF